MTVWYNQLAPRKSTIYKFHVFSTNSSCYDEKGPALKKIKNNLLFFFFFFFFFFFNFLIVKPLIRCFDQVALKMSKQTKKKKAWLKCNVTLVIDDSSTLIIYIPWTNRVFTCPCHEKKA